jgi:hypothetical protein
MKRLFSCGFALTTVLATTAVVAQENKGTTKETTKQTPQETPQGTTQNPVVIAVTTVTLAESTGCWARIHDGQNFTGRTLTLMGEQSLPHLEFGVGFDWEGDIDSIVVGPKAKLAVFEDENYGDKKRDLAANERVADLHKTIFSEGVESLKLTCVGTQR